MLTKQDRLLRVGVLGCGPIAQFAHFDACRKAKNADLYALCDVSPELLAKMAGVHEPRVTFTDHRRMLADPRVEAVIVAVADQYHVPLCQEALAAGKHVLVEKPLGTSVEECEALRRRAAETGLTVQIGNNRRFDPGVAFAGRFIRDEMGPIVALKHWYYDSTSRYTMTDNLQPIPRTASGVRRPEGNPKADKRRYFLLTHGSHLVDTARFLGGELAAVQARLVERSESWCWFIAVEYADGAIGHLDLIIPIRGDFEEGFQVFGEGGSVQGKVYLPWYHKSSVVEAFSVRDRQYRRPLGEDAFTYKLQIEALADRVLHGQPSQAATVDDGAAAVRALVAIARSVERGGARVALAEVTGAV
jgi:predicted dehydrogenase